MKIKLLVTLEQFKMFSELEHRKKNFFEIKHEPLCPVHPITKEEGYSLEGLWILETTDITLVNNVLTHSPET